MEEIIDAAKKANIHDFIQSLPDGYDTFVGERGTLGRKTYVCVRRTDRGWKMSASGRDSEPAGDICLP